MSNLKNLKIGASLVITSGAAGGFHEHNQGFKHLGIDYDAHEGTLKKHPHGKALKKAAKNITSLQDKIDSMDYIGDDATPEWKNKIKSLETKKKSIIDEHTPLVKEFKKDHSDWFKKLSKDEKAKYLKDHPKSTLK